MGDHKLLDTSQIVNGIALLLSFFVGYKYALKRHEIKETNETTKKAEDEKDGAVGGVSEPVIIYNLHIRICKYIGYLSALHQHKLQLQNGSTCSQRFKNGKG